MLLTLLVFLMRFVDISKMHSERCSCGTNADAAGNKVKCWQHAAKDVNSNSSSTSSGCDSNASSKENFFDEQRQQQQQQQQHHSLTPQQLQQIRYYQQLQQQQIQLLQQQLQQRRRLQQHLREQGVNVRKNAPAMKTKTSPALTCNQQYLIQQRLQQQQQQQQHLRNVDNNNIYNDNDILNNNFIGGGGFDYADFAKGQKSRRGMTEFSTNNDISNKSHLSQPLQNSPRHFHTHSSQNIYQQQQLQTHQNSPQNFTNFNKPFTHTTLQQKHHNNKNNQQTLPINSSANIISSNINASTTSTISTVVGGQTTATATATSSATSSPTSATHSPLHYKNPLNSPNNSPFAYAYYGGGNNKVSATTTTATTAQQHQLQQHLRSSNKLPLLTQTQYQQHLNDLLLQQQHLQQQQQQLLSAKDADDELSEESLKQNVAIVLNNLDRYNNALRSIILNEQVSSNSGVFLDDSLFVASINSANGNNNFLFNSGCNANNAMATPATPESDYNSNATTPGSRCNMPLDSHMLQQQQHLVGFAAGGGGAAASQTTTSLVGGVGLNLNAGINGGGVGGIGGFCTIGNNVASNNLNSSFVSSHDFTHDNSDYQWFLDYGYRDGCGGIQRSVLSSLSGSYNGITDSIYYEDLAKNLDANLAEVDMESFRAEDINPLLSKLQRMLPQAAQHSNNIFTSYNEPIDNSICKSELLFSPVKESVISMNSLDMDAYPDEGDIILTCKANKDNYTIAFEGSALYSDESFYEPTENAACNKQTNFIKLHSNLEDIVKRKPLEVSMSRSEQAFNARGKLQKSNTTQLQRYPSGNNNTADTIMVPIQHAPFCTMRKSSSLPNLRERKDPQMSCERVEQQLNVSQAVSTSTVDCCKMRNLLPMCPMPISCNSTSVSFSERLQQQQQLQQTPQHHHHHHHRHQQQQQQQLQQIEHQQQQQQRHKHRCCCFTAASTLSSAGAAIANNHNSNSNACAAGVSGQAQKHTHISGSASSSGSSNPPAFNLVKLFIKQKSSNCSTEEQVSGHTCMDISSGCWPSSDAAGSSSSSSLEHHLRKKSMNDSGKGSALSRHDEEDLLHARDHDESVFQTEACMPKKQLRMRNDAALYDDEHSSSSTGSLTVTNSPAHRRRSMPLRNPQLCHLTVQHKSVASAGSLQSSDGSRSNSEQLTQVYVSSGGTHSAGSAFEQRKNASKCTVNPAVSAASSSEMVTRSMQTSCGSLSTRSSFSDRFRCVPPSFLAKLNNLGEERQAPIYVIYPNYSLPDLGFVKTNASADVIFSPFNYKNAVSGGAPSGMGALKQRFSLGCNEDEILKTMDYKHVVDWESLATLLPAEYRLRLKHIPEMNRIMRDLEVELSQRPLFCMTPPIRRNRPHICDCMQLQQQTQLPTGEEGSSSSGSSQQPSSGYRGSSTLLTDSAELENADPLKQMYVYQYEQQRMDSGVEMSPSGVSTGRTPPQPMPRGILRKSSSGQTARNKRNSMIEEQQTKMSKLEKRRSLQEPPSHYGLGSAEELCEVFEEEAELYAMLQPRKERLSRKDMDARTRAENFLSTLPRSELKHYAEIAAILESSTEHQIEYDPAALKKEVSRALSQQKKVSFNDIEEQDGNGALQQQLLQPEVRQRFSTPPNSPNISIAGGGLRAHAAPATVPRRCSQAELHATERRKLATLDEREQRKIESNRFKRLQIQWELMSKDSNMLKDLASAQHTKSGGSTPTSATAAHKSRIPRPVSYPAGKIVNNSKNNTKTVVKPAQPRLSTPSLNRIATQDVSGKTTRSPSRMVQPKRYSMTAAPGNATTTGTSPSTATTPTTRARTPTSRTAVTAPNTPKRKVQSPRTIPRVR